MDFQAIKQVTIDDIKEVFEPFDWLEIKKHYQSDHTLKIERLKFIGPLGQPNSIKIDIDLTQELILPVEKTKYKNAYDVDVTVPVMVEQEICAEKIRAINERARYRDFYDLALIMKGSGFKPEEIVEILKKKELRKPLSKGSILDNLEIAEEAQSSGAESLYYREEISVEEIHKNLQSILDVI